LIEELDEQKNKFLIFAHHSKMLDILEAKLLDLRANYIRIDGSTPAMQRAKDCQQFQTRPECKFALLSITAAGVG
jgi:SWI/SNF-related matrix-associated actin-dependent regulator 1 of chromatin subfamily A